MITFVDPTKIKPTQQPGWCFVKAGFRKVGHSDDGKVILQLSPSLMPSSSPPLVSLRQRIW
jgi:hypothetical protein